MTILTTRQRDLLELLLNANTPLASNELAEKIGLTNRQVNYSVNGIKTWLSLNNYQLLGNAGSGYSIIINKADKQTLLKKLKEDKFQLILSSSQRQQLFSLLLLLSDAPLNLHYFEEITLVSRSTILKDLDEIETWLQSWNIELLRKQNYGIEIVANEIDIQTAVCSLLWGDHNFEKPLFSTSLIKGLHFSLENDARLLEIVSIVNQKIQKIHVLRNLQMIALAEEQLGGRFSDDAVIFLALRIAIQGVRIKSGFHLHFSEDTIQVLKDLNIWTTSVLIAKKLGWSTTRSRSIYDIAGIAIHLASAPRNERWLSDFEFNDQILTLIDKLIHYISQAYELEAIIADRTLHDSMVNYLAPACFRTKFNLWMPALSAHSIPIEENSFDYQIAKQCINIVKQSVGINLPQREINILATLLRAANIRLNPHKNNKVIVVCPSGMATAQLLMARLGARFPHFEDIQVISLRKLTNQLINQSHLVITTIDLPTNLQIEKPVIKVHPLLLPEDIEKITEFLQRKEKK